MFRMLLFFMFPGLFIGGFLLIVLLLLFARFRARAAQQRNMRSNSDPNKTSYSTGTSSQRYSAYGGRRARTWSRSARSASAARGSSAANDVIEIPLLEVIDVPDETKKG